jgi:redox-sensitive bicupin YhaK (pirin superfamily)
MLTLSPAGTSLTFSCADRDAEGAAAAPLLVLLVAGKPLREPIARHGPFVMNSRAELQTAFAEYQNGTFIKHKATQVAF